jgi:DNA-binding NarL/FixJ family response regulator
MRILLADNHTLVRSGLRLLLETMADVIVVGEASDEESALRLTGQLSPDIVLMDLAMPGDSGIEAVREIAAHFPETHVLLLSTHADEPHVQTAFAAGASGYILKGANEAELEQALQELARGRHYLTPAIERTRVDTGADSPPIEALTLRQRQVLTLVAEGMSTKQVAARLGLSVKTVEAHRGAIMTRLGIRDLAGLVRFAVRVGLVSDGS